MSDSQFYLFNGEPLKSELATDRGFAFGDGVFETVAVKEFIIPFKEMHIQRLAESCARLKINFSFSEVQRLFDLAQAHVRKLPNGNGRLKLVVTRGEIGELGSYVSLGAQPNTAIFYREVENQFLQPNSVGKVLKVAGTPLQSFVDLAGIKHLNRLNYIIGCINEGLGEKEKDTDLEILFRDEHKNIIDTMHHNIFFVDQCGSGVVTPILNRCGVAGVMRRVVIERLLPEEELSFEERIVSLEELLDAKEVFLTNALHGIVPVRSLNNTTYGSHAVCQTLQSQLKRMVDNT